MPGQVVVREMGAVIDVTRDGGPSRRRDVGRLLRGRLDHGEVPGEAKRTAHGAGLVRAEVRAALEGQRRRCPPACRADGSAAAFGADVDDPVLRVAGGPTGAADVGPVDVVIDPELLVDHGLAAARVPGGLARRSDQLAMQRRLACGGHRGVHHRHRTADEPLGEEIGLRIGGVRLRGGHEGLGIGAGRLLGKQRGDGWPRLSDGARAPHCEAGERQAEQAAGHSATSRSGRPAGSRRSPSSTVIFGGTPMLIFAARRSRAGSRPSALRRPSM